MLWWFWIVFGLVLLVLELVVPSGFFIFFFGVGSLLTGLILALGVELDSSAQWLTCVFLSLASLLLCRRFLMGKWASASSFSSNPEGREVLVTQEAQPGSSGSCEFRGTNWSIRNQGPELLSVGDKALVEGREGLTLLVRKV